MPLHCLVFDLSIPRYETGVVYLLLIVDLVCNSQTDLKKSPPMTIRKLEAKLLPGKCS